MIFDGEFHFGYPEKGKTKKYYNDGKLEFEGEVLEGIVWNEKGYNKEGKIDYEISNGKGFIKEYDNNDKIIYEGEYLNGERNGKGKLYHKNGKLQYEGKFENGKANGKGKEYDRDGNMIFEGEYLNNKRYNGRGIDISKKIEYEVVDGEII